LKVVVKAKNTKFTFIYGCYILDGKEYVIGNASDEAIYQIIAIFKKVKEYVLENM